MGAREGSRERNRKFFSEDMNLTSQISKNEMRSAIEDKLCAYFAVTSETATDDQLFQACAMVIREIMSRLLAAESKRDKQKEVHYCSYSAGVTVRNHLCFLQRMRHEEV